MHGYPPLYLQNSCASAGFDWVRVDLQHGLISFAEACQQLLALDALRVPALVRVSWNEPHLIMRMLDAGAAGVIVPMVNSATEAAAAVSACRYPPKGSRSWGPTRVNERWRAGPGGEAEEALCVVMVETEEAVAAVDEIASVAGLDAILVGPRDLALSRSWVAEEEHQHEEEVMGRIVGACKAEGVLAGITCEDDKSIEKWFAVGFRLLFGLRSDVRLLSDHAAALVRETSDPVGRTGT